MKTHCILTALMALFFSVPVTGGAADYVPRPLVWTSQSSNSSGSMPCGGHDIGLNVWVERGDVLMYAAQSGWFDENNTLLKAGRWRLHIDGQPFGGNDFEQRLCLDEGAVYIRGGGVEVRIWVDVEQPVVFVAIESPHTRQGTLSYESWRYRDRPVSKAECQQCSYKWLIPTDCTTFADSISADGDRLRFWHCNRQQTVFDFTVTREHLDAIKDSLYNPIAGLLMEGEMEAPGFRFTGTSAGVYASTDYRSWNFRNTKLRKAVVRISLKAQPLLSQQPPSSLSSPLSPSSPSLPPSPLSPSLPLSPSSPSSPSLPPCPPVLRRVSPPQSRQRSARWWHAYWQRSWIQTDGRSGEAARMVRNYELMRYLLGCNAYGQWPTKFNGGLFTFDPVYVDSTATFTPDYRKWGGGTMTAQNQRLVYWPLLKSGDRELLRPQLDTYLRMLPTAKAWARHHWGHGGACFSEQIENSGLPNPAEYGKHPPGTDLGVERNAWLEYEWDTVLEFCLMALLSQEESGPYEALAAECLRFFDEHYQWQARQLGAKALNDSGRLVIYPGSGCETYKMAYNPASTIAALQTVAAAISSDLTQRLPAIPLRTVDGHTCIAPAEVWARIQNTETPQLYPVWPWRVYGLSRPGLDIALNTYWHDPHALAMRSTKGWKQDNIWAACLGLTGEARRLNAEKLSDGPYRFPAFWDAGFDWAPDHNRGGAGMIGLQEMLLQETSDGQPLLFPAWPREWNCRFRLYTSNGRMVEACMENGVITTK